MACPNLACDTYPDALADPVVADIDLVGNGVLSAFILSAFLTVLAVVYGYLSDSLPKSQLSETDQSLIADFQQLIKQCTKVIHKPLRRIWRSNSAYRSLTRAQRERAVERFILTLSDQQLVTGLAIMIATVYNRCNSSVYDWLSATVLAWFSATTHLSTLDALREYFLAHKTVRNWRIMGMLIMLGLLVNCWVVYLIAQPFSYAMPIQCPLQRMSTFRPNEVFKIARSVIILWFIFGLIIIVVLVFLYAKRICQAYGYGSTDSFHVGLVTISIVSRMKNFPKMTGEELSLVMEEVNLEIASCSKQRILNSIQIARRSKSKWRERYHTLQWALYSYSTSLLSAALEIAFMLSCGVWQIFMIRYRSGRSLEVDSRMGFGQIVPIFLLCLPLLGAAETYYDAKEITSPEQADVAPGNQLNEDMDGCSLIPPTTFPSINDESAPRELETLGQMSPEQLRRIERLFYRECRDVKRLVEAAAYEGDMTSVQKKEQELLLKTQELEEIGKSLSSNLMLVKLILLEQVLHCATLGVVSYVGIGINSMNNVQAVVRLTVTYVLLLLQVITKFYTLIRGFRWLLCNAESFPRWLSEAREKAGIADATP